MVTLQVNTSGEQSMERIAGGNLDTVTYFVCFGDDSHRRDARRSHPCEDRRDAETAHQVCTVLSYLCFQLENQRANFCRKQNCQIFNAQSQGLTFSSHR